MKSKTRMMITACGIVALLFSAVAVLMALDTHRRIKHDEEIKPYLTYTRLMYTARRCDDFRKERGSWPESLARLREFGPELSEWAVDMWQRDLVFVPYNESLGYGRVISYGRDGAPGGSAAADRDLEVRFPLAGNEDWNLKSGEGLKKPYLRVGQLIYPHGKSPSTDRRANERIEPMRGSAVRLALYSVTCGALPLMAHPRR